ncbi:MAG: hypothetical protein WBY88_07350, partial [Desulfosarcina sp.]
RERRTESAVLLGHWALGCLAVAAMTGLAGIAVAWHRSIPGAMCGTGVLQALGTDGSRAMIFWGVSLTLLYAWRVLDRLDGQNPASVLTRDNARMMVSAAPFLTLALFYSWQGLMRVENVPPVNCCAAVYDQVLDAPSLSAAVKRLVPFCLWSSLVGTVALLVIAGVTIRTPHYGSGALTGIVAILWALTAVVTVKWVWSATYFQVLSHPCPWCLFQSHYWGAGFFIFGCVAIVVMEGMALWLADRIRHQHPVLADPAIRRRRQSACRMVAALIIYAFLTAGPAIAWRVQTGVWIQD